jgi:RNA polymerase-binding transcription factor DksA
MSADLAIGTPEAAGPAAAAVRPAPAAAAPEADHLTPQTLPGWRALLESHWRARLERVTELSLAYHDAEEARAGQPPSRARSARPLLRQAVTERRALAEIEAALARLGNGRFGRCERCGGVISAPRLTRTPQARYCMSCETGAEYRGPRQH